MASNQQDKTNILFILDRSGSMSTIKDSTISGFNEFVKGQANESKVGECIMSLYQFDNEFDTVYENKDITNVPMLDNNTFVPRGGTALLDAIGKVVRSSDDIEGTNKGLVVILTDGEENSSGVYHKELIKNMVTDMREGYNSEFLYLGANQDACFQAESMGMSRTNEIGRASCRERV